MKIVTLTILFVVIVLIFSFFAAKQKTYLPVCIFLRDTSQYSKEILLNLKAAFASRKIKTISKDELRELSRAETHRIMEPYYRNLKNTGGKPDFDQIKSYMETHQKDVCNSFSISIPVSKEGEIGDTIKWGNWSIPFRFNDERRKIQNKFVLLPQQKTSVLQIMQVITDSIIASKILIEE